MSMLIAMPDDTNKLFPYDPTSPTSLGQLIRYRRERKGWSQQDLGNKFQPPVDQSRISKWEADESKPRKERLIQMARLFGVASVEFLDAERFTHGGKPLGKKDYRYFDAYDDVDRLGDPKVRQLFVRIVVALAALVKLVAEKRRDST